MLKAMGMSAIQGLQVVQLSSIQDKRTAFRPDERPHGRGEGREGGRGNREGGRGGRGDKGGRGFGRGDKGGRGGRGDKGGRGFGRSRGGGGNTESTEKASS